MSNSSLVDYTHLSRNNYNVRKNATYNPTGIINSIVIHHVAGNCSVETLGNIFDSGREVSANYGIGSDGRVGMYVEECNRSWCSSSREADFFAITIECSNDEYAPTWHVSDAAFNKLIDLCVDICKRNGFRLHYTGDKRGNLLMHRYFANTSCPEQYLISRFPDIERLVNARLDGEEVKIEESKPSNDSCPYPETSSLLKKSDMYNVNVKWVQWHLCRLGYLPSCEIDGYFGDKTESAVKALQKDAQISIDGVVGNDTKKALKGETKAATTTTTTTKTSSYPIPTVTLSTKYVNECREDVKWVQERLTAKGFGTKVDGYFGNDTRQKVIEAQGFWHGTDSSILIDGIVGSQTISKLRVML